jgi:hypothetical protein
LLISASGGPGGCSGAWDTVAGRAAVPSDAARGAAEAEILSLAARLDKPCNAFHADITTPCRPYQRAMHRIEY